MKEGFGKPRFPKALASCSESGILDVCQNIYSKAYSGADILTIIKTDKSIKEHAYDKIKKK